MGIGHLCRLADQLRREFDAARRIDGQLVERDIAARRHEAAGGRLWANRRERMQRQLEKLGITENEWCKRELGCDIATMRRRVQLAKGWDQYERNRREEGDNGQYGLYYGLSLIRTERARAMTTRRPFTRSVPEAARLDIAKVSVHHGRSAQRAWQAEIGISPHHHNVTRLLAAQTHVWWRWHRL